MDKAFPSGGKDCGFKSRLGLYFMFQGGALNRIARSAGLNMIIEVGCWVVFDIGSE